MTLEEIINKSKSEDYTAEAMKSDITAVIGEAVKAKAESIESALTELGFKAPEGTSARDHVVATVKTLKTEAEKAGVQNTELLAQVDKFSKNAPKAEEIRAEFEAKLLAKDEEVKTLNSSIAKNKRLSKLGEITSTFKYDPTVAEQAKRLLKVELSEMDNNFGTEEREGVLVLTRNGVTHLDSHARVVTAESYLRNAMEPFFEKAAPPANPAQPTPGGKVAFKTNAELMEYAKTEGINLYTKEGQDRLKEISTPPPSI